MSPLQYAQYQRISLKTHPEFNEKWVQERVAEDPSRLGLGDLVLKDKERLQPHAGRLDLLLQDSELGQRYEVEIQLGKTDESHIIRTLEYWDIERKRYPQYDHTAVIIAEDITSRFLNVISLFNGFIPLVAIQMMAIQVGDSISLVFTTVLDQMTLGLVEEDEEIQEVVDRHFWEKKGTTTTVAIVDDLLDLIHQFDSSIELNYNKYYIGLQKDGRSNNFVRFKPQKNSLTMSLRLPKSETTEDAINNAGLDLMDYTRWNKYQIRLSKSDVKEHSEALSTLLKQAYDSGMA